ncbi:Rz1-like lysis system protein LysC [Entomomonas sp. E2T0]|uniref:Rz1-like lysis system protein LysC n=1 Tax=Entomomonas sp. E2T0 TaxID=2930213 RepID=UPI0039B6FA5E
MKIKPFITGLISLFLIACTDKQIITESQIIRLTPPVITACERLSIKDCQPKTNGELYECALIISKNLALCADQTDALINWQNDNSTSQP